MIGLILQSRVVVTVLLLVGAPVWCACPMLMAAEAGAPAVETRACGGGSGCGERERPDAPSDPCECDHPAPEQMVTPAGKHAAADVARPAPAPAWTAGARRIVFLTGFVPPDSGLNTSPPRGDPSLLSLHTMLTT